MHGHRDSSRMDQIRMKTLPSIGEVVPHLLRLHSVQIHPFMSSSSLSPGPETLPDNLLLESACTPLLSVYFPFNKIFVLCWLFLFCVETKTWTLSPGWGLPWPCHEHGTSSFILRLIHYEQIKYLYMHTNNGNKIVYTFKEWYLWSFQRASQVLLSHPPYKLSFFPILKQEL